MDSIVGSDIVPSTDAVAGDRRQTPVIVLQACAGADSHCQWIHAELSFDRIPPNLVEEKHIVRGYGSVTSLVIGFLIPV